MKESISGLPNCLRPIDRKRFGGKISLGMIGFEGFAQKLLRAVTVTNAAVKVAARGK